MLDLPDMCIRNNNERETPILLEERYFKYLTLPATEIHAKVIGDGFSHLRVQEAKTPTRTCIIL